MTTFTLRPALESESHQIKDLIHLVGINPMSLDWKRFVVAVDADGRVIGTGQLKPHGGGLLELSSIAVSPERRGEGIARAVIESLLSDSPRPIYLTCRSSLRTFYEKFGFDSVETNEMPAYFKRIRKLADALLGFARQGEHLLVMKLK